jgi:hypothetical protein
MLTLPRYSQYLDVADPTWQPRACGIVALKTVFDYWSGIHDTPTMNALIQEGLALNGFIPGIGWKHQALVDIAHAHGYAAKRYDWSKDDPVEAWERLCAKIKNGPAIASIHMNLCPTSPDGHLVVVHTINAIVHYHDPARKDRNQISQETSTANFVNGWKRRVILIYPQKSVHS